jgi:hypothetical protein
MSVVSDKLYKNVLPALWGDYLCVVGRSLSTRLYCIVFYSFVGDFLEEGHIEAEICRHILK